MKRRKWLGLLLAAVMALTMVPTMAFASGSWGDNYENTTEFTITSVDDLKAFAAMVNGGKNFEGKTVKLVNDIDLANEEWTPIGTKEKPFAGTFVGTGSDGVNCTISNLVISDKNLDYAGLFGNLNSPGTIEHLNIENVTITARAQVGALAGAAYTGTVQDCHINGDIKITGNYKVGGLAGEGYARVEGCSVNGAEGSYIKGIYSAADYEGDNVGGLIGYRGEGNIVTEDCSVSGVAIEGTRKVGGLIGTLYDNNTINKCSVSDIIVSSNATREYAEENITKMGIGGMFGIISPNSNGQGKITDCAARDITLNCNDDVKDIIRMGYVSGGVYNTPTFTGPDETRMPEIEIDLTGTNSMPEGVLRPQGGNSEAIGIDAVAQVGSETFVTLEDAVKAVMDSEDSEKIVTILRDITVETWNQIWNIEGITIDGNDKTIKVTGSIESLGNNDAVLHSAGGNTFKDITFDLSGIAASNAQGTRAINAAAGDTIENVKIIGGEILDYGITCSGTDADNDTITIKDCVFESCRYGVYDSESGSVENVVINGSTFKDCDYATIMRAESGEFTDNTVNGGKLNIMESNQTVTGNTFTDGSRIKFYDTGATFKQNNISADSYLDFDEDATGQADVSENYWGGGEPSKDQLGGEDNTANVTGTDVYYVKDTMNEEDLSTYEPPVTEPDEEEPASGADDPSVDNEGTTGTDNPGANDDRNNEKKPVDDATPTGDDSSMMIPMAAAAAALAAMTVVMATRKRQSR